MSITRECGGGWKGESAIRLVSVLGVKDSTPSVLFGSNCVCVCVCVCVLMFPLRCRVVVAAAASRFGRVAPLARFGRLRSFGSVAGGDKNVGLMPPLSQLKATEIMMQAHSLTEELLQPLNDKMLGPLERSGDTASRPYLPFVFCLGNHSSGKSTFINHVLGREVQKTGVAPTDDSFTVIAPSDHGDMDQDGPALVGNPDAGFSALRTFGPGLINHMHLKVRSDLNLDGIMMIDSPGMIDSPATQSNIWDFTKSSRDRGYDFMAVTRWFAERADVILLFFDPDKPGTTGETLACLTQSLAGLDHKLHIILNKVDQFEKIHDFARAYGSLCWNLSKVISRKDLPRIYTMRVPGDHPGSRNALAEALVDLEKTRLDVIAEVHKAPERRVDNTITHLYDSARLLRTHVLVAEAVRKAYSSVRIKWRAGALAAFLCGQCLGYGAMTLALPQASLFFSVLGFGSAGGLYAFGSNALDLAHSEMTSEQGLDVFFREQHAVDLAEGDEFIESLWLRARPQLQISLKTFGLGNVPKLSSSSVSDLDDIIVKKSSDLRRLANPLPERDY